MRTRIATGVGLAVLSLGGCVTHTPLRTFDNVNPPAVQRPECAALVKSEQDRAKAPAGIADLAVPSWRCDAPEPDSVCTSTEWLQAEGPLYQRHRDAVSCVAHEWHVPVKDSPVSLDRAGFDVHIFEFDDEGQPWNRNQQNRSLEVLRAQLKEPAVVLAFVHGWKNDSSVCNGNISCFREVLGVLAKAEQTFSQISGEAPRRVIGVYIGWRGLTASKEPFKEFTFWGRKHTAHTIGDNGAVTNLISRLRGIVANARGTGSRASLSEAARTTSLVLVGHSFGAALLYSALATSLNASVAAATEQAMGAPRRGGEFQRDSPSQAQAQQPSAQQTPLRQPLVNDELEIEVESSGDLVVLVNPAMEASRFANLNEVRNLRFSPRQVPIFMTLASEADKAVGGFFPIGQAFSTISRAARSRDMWFSMVKGFGMYQPYHTHRLVLRPGEDVPKPQEVEGTCRCKGNLGAFGDALVTRLKRFYTEISKDGGGLPDPDTLRLAAYQEMLYSRLEPLRDVHPHSPFIMARVDPGVIGEHSDIFNPRLVDFLIEFVVHSEIKRAIVGAYRNGDR